MEIHTNLKISGMSCEACQKLVEKRLMKIPGVNRVAIELKSGLAEILANRRIDSREIMEALKGTEYKIYESSN